MHYTEESANWQQRFVLARAYTHTHMAPFVETSLAKATGREERNRTCPSLQLRSAHTHVFIQRRLATARADRRAPLRGRGEVVESPVLYKLAAARGGSLAAPAEDVQRERSVGQLLEEVPGLGARHQAHGLSVDGD